MKLNDTITAIATPRGAGGIAIIRLSGAEDEKIAGAMVKPYNNKTLSELESHKLTLSRVLSYDKSDYMIDEALVAVMRAPKSYTGEDVVEINCHGGYLVADKILNGLLHCGARLAEAGEFTRRAFINGKTDLSGAEAVIDLMESATEEGLHNAAVCLTGVLADKIKVLREETLGIAANVSAAADYPDEVDLPESAEMLGIINGVQAEVDGLLNGFDKGRIMRDGVRTAIVGRPNVGKSSLLNAILRADRAIVTDIPGTTRDTIEELVSIGGIALRLTDTAGIRDGRDEAERIGIEKSKKNIEDSDLCLFVLDASEELTNDDFEIAKSLNGKAVIVILNKCDKQSVISENKIKNMFLADATVVETATPKNGEVVGIDKLEKIISDMFVGGEVKMNDVYISNERQKDALIKAKNAITHARECIESGMPNDLLFIDLEDALSAFGEVTGETVQEEIVNSVFERFCVGK